MKQLFLVNITIPFPASDGGLIAVIAENETECFDIVVEDGVWDKEYQNILMPAIKSAPRYSLLEEEESGIIESFIP